MIMAGRFRNGFIPLVAAGTEFVGLTILCAGSGFFEVLPVR